MSQERGHYQVAAKFLGTAPYSEINDRSGDAKSLHDARLSVCCEIRLRRWSAIVAALTNMSLLGNFSLSERFQRLFRLKHKSFMKVISKLVMKQGISWTSELGSRVRDYSYKQSACELLDTSLIV